MFLARSQRDLAVALCRALAEPGAVIAVTGEAGGGKTTLVNAVVAALTGGARPVWHTRGMEDGAPAALRPLLDRVPADDLSSCSMSFAGTGNPAARPGTPEILVLDDAHELSPGFLRGLSAVLCGSGLDALLPRLVLVGRPEFWSKLDEPSLVFLRDRIDARIVLRPMPHQEAEGFVEHLFRLAGGSARSLLAADVLHGVLGRSQGNPRRIIAELEKALAPEADERHPPVAGQPTEHVPASPEPESRPRRPARRLLALILGLGGIAAALAGAATLLPARMPVLELWATRVQPAPEAPAALEPTAPALTTNEGGVSTDAPGHPATGVPDMAERTGAEAPPHEEAAPGPVRTDEPPAPTAEVAPVPEARPAETGARTEALVRPVPQPATAALPGRPARQELPKDVVAVLVRRGKAMLELRDVSAARRLFERAALAGSAEAAAALGRTYDPGLQGGAAWEVDTDRAAAIRWYGLAASLGDEDARLRLDRLGKEAGP